ncbi:immunoglobulin superfamily DCC subclass member 3-like isoform X1 [Montipora foliosa]|uniref:immunoglobulin superfamily DCC subclass member 3-like isoform X1 n=1 Tax=Montipora foliosa TaxID=591990 RepID=UPI0035F1FB8C
MLLVIFLFCVLLKSSTSCSIAKNDFADPSLPTVELRTIEFPGDNILPTGYNVTIACISNSSKKVPGYRDKPYWIQYYFNDDKRILHDCGGSYGSVDSEASKVCKFFIQNATEKNSGNYTCWSLNQIQCTRRTIELEFREPSPPTFTKIPPRELLVSSGHVVNMRCEASGVPLPVITWFKDGVPVSEEKLSVVKRASLISFKSVTSTDEGVYWCEARNPFGWKISSDTSLSLTQSPTITFHPQNVQVFLEGNFTIVSFICKATGNPTPLISWLRDNSTEANGTVIQTGSISTLILVLLGEEKNFSKYSCLAKNTDGKAYSKEGALMILASRSQSVTFGGAGPTNGYLSFYGHPTSTSTSPGDLVVFTCLAEGFPVPEITWLKNDEANVDGSATTSHGNYSAISVLRIYPVEEKHGGTYNCRATNRVGKAVVSRKAILSIKGDASNLSSVFLMWISVVIGVVVLLIAVAILIVVMYNKRRKAAFYVSNEIQGNSTTQNGQQLANIGTCAATKFQRTNKEMKNVYMENVF